MKEKFSPGFLHSVESAASLARSLLYNMPPHNRSPSPRLRLLRVYSSIGGFRQTFGKPADSVIFELANLRYLSMYTNAKPRFNFLFSHLWNLQTLHILDLVFCNVKMSLEIWKMPLLRHVMISRFKLPDPPKGEVNFILQNLQTLSCVMDFKFSEEVIKRIPNVKKLGLLYYIPEDHDKERFLNLRLNNLCHFQKLESLSLKVFYDIFYYAGKMDKGNIQSNLVSFPPTLKKLTLYGIRLSWEDLNIRIGSLPLLQFLKLGGDACIGPKWETIEGHFCSLRALDIFCVDGLIYWDTDSDHFPCLEHLYLCGLEDLEEIPSSIGDITTLKSIQLKGCSRAINASAIRIKKEQEENGNEDLQVIIDFVET